MLIGQKYKIESDSLNITISEKKLSKKARKEYWKPIGYFSCVANALKFMVDLEVNKTELSDFKAVVKKQEELYQLILSLKIKLGE